MEHAIFISDIPKLKHFMMSDFGRIYYGNEFCEHLLPTRRQLETVLEFAGKKGVAFTFVTPVLYEAGLAKVDKLLQDLPRGTEVVINDIGLFDMVKGRDLVPVHGRMLFASIKDPRIGRNSPFQELFSAHNLQPPYLELLKKYNVERVEIVNAGQSYDLSAISGMSISVYYPFVNCTVTRKCVFANMAAAAQGQTSGIGFVENCERKCGGRILKADIDGSTAYIMGNAQFYRNDAPPEWLTESAIDRLVFMPVFPNSNSGVSDMDYLDWSFPYITGEYKKKWGLQPDQTVEKLIEMIGMPQGSGALDIGCGAGRNAPTLIRNGFQYTGIDIAGEAIHMARAQFPDRRFLHGDALDHDWSGESFDVVIDYGFFHTIPPRRRGVYFDVLSRLVKPGGYLIAAAWDLLDGDDARSPVEYVCGALPEWGCRESEFLSMAGPAFEMKHTGVNRKLKRPLKYYAMRRSPQA